MKLGAKDLLRGGRPRKPPPRVLQGDSRPAERQAPDPLAVPGVRGRGEGVGEGSGSGRPVDHPPARPAGKRAPRRDEQELGQLLGELIGDEEFERFEAQAAEWMGLGDEAETEITEWGLRRSFVHMQVLDHIATGAEGAARVHTVIRANRAFVEDLVKLLRNMSRKGDAEATPAAAAKKQPTKKR